MGHSVHQIALTVNGLIRDKQDLRDPVELALHLTAVNGWNGVFATLQNVKDDCAKRVPFSVPHAFVSIVNNCVGGDCSNDENIINGDELKFQDIIVDPLFKSVFEVPIKTDRYDIILRHVPDTLVCTRPRLKEIVRVLCKELEICHQDTIGNRINDDSEKNAFNDCNNLPPWRRTEVIMNKWERPRSRFDIQRKQIESQSASRFQKYRRPDDDVLSNIREKNRAKERKSMTIEQIKRVDDISSMYIKSPYEERTIM
jgi:uncharacterized protein (TIGR01615 family)